MENRKNYHVAVVGATGLVGRTFLELAEKSDFPFGELRLFASPQSEGKTLRFRGEDLPVLAADRESFRNTDFVFFFAGREVSAEYVPVAAENGAIAIDNSSRFRMEREVPLIVPEINFSDYRGAERKIANPNCSTIQAVLPLAAIAREFGLKSVSYVTFQAVSGSGQRGINDLSRTRAGETPSFYPYAIEKTCIPQIGDFDAEGNSEEERKMRDETRKILHLPDLPVSATCVRVPVENAHAVCVSAETELFCSAEEARKAIAAQKGCVIVDDPARSLYPVSILASGRNEVFVGRIRRNEAKKKGILFYCVADNLRRGAAYNALLIAEKIVERVSGEQDQKICKQY